MRQGLFAALMKWLEMPRHGWELAAFILGALGVGSVLLGILMSVPSRYRKTVVALVTFISGLYYSLEFLIPPNMWGLHPARNPLTEVRPQVGEIIMIVGSFAMLLGIWNLFQIHGATIVRRNPNRYNSAAFFVSFFTIVIVGFLKDAKVGAVSDLYTILFRGFLISLDATMFSLIAFYIVSAAYRAFRIRSAEAVLMMAAAAIIMLALVPAGAAITNWLPTTGILSVFRIERIGYWLLIWPNMAAQRAIAFGIAVGALAMGLRIWLSLEKGSFFDRQL